MTNILESLEKFKLRKYVSDICIGWVYEKTQNQTIRFFFGVTMLLHIQTSKSTKKLLPL